MSKIIPPNVDMYTYKTPGNYYCPANVDVGTLRNCPVLSAFTLKIYKSANTSGQYLIQEYTTYDGAKRVLQFFDSDANRWTTTSHITNADLRIIGASSMDLFFDASNNNSCVTKWIVNDHLQYQLVAGTFGLHFDRWDGNTWTNVWSK